LADSGILSLDNLILVGDLNITLSSDEVWGGSNSSGSLADYYKLLLQSKNLVDLRPDKVVPTWRNGRQGIHAIAKRLDRCIISEGLLSVQGLYRSWVEYPFISDHAPIYYSWKLRRCIDPYPFKLNLLWVLEEDYKFLVYKVWKDPKFNTELGCQRRLVWKLKELKRKTKEWAKQREGNIQKRMVSLESQIKDTFLNFVDDYSQLDKEILLGNLEMERNKLLKINEEKWRQRSRAIWINSGDRNTKFFHHFANHRRIHKHIWEINDEEGNGHSGQNAIKEATTQYFKNFFKARSDSFTNEQVQVTNLFSRMVFDEEQVLYLNQLLLMKLKKSLACSKEIRVQALMAGQWNSFNFFDLVGEDLVQMIEESRKLGL
jgi:hypothetical protein